MEASKKKHTWKKSSGWILGIYSRFYCVAGELAQRETENESLKLQFACILEAHPAKKAMVDQRPPAAAVRPDPPLASKSKRITFIGKREEYP